ncbi:glycosyltransferase family 39 protein [Aggregatimonas sangjinii]|nr:glycosyltransferase family 39 protein [Aggregatimonas sangjinii]
MFVTLIENDSAQFAVMAMRMFQENDFINLFKGPNEYLDKPHMHYWLAALSYKIFGLHDWAYRIPAILATLLGAFSCFGLGKLLYNADTGRLAALIFMTAQTIVLSVIDVRTDAVLTGWTIFAIWQLTAYIEKKAVLNIILGAFGTGIAFSTKGQIAILVIGLPLLCHLAYTRKWKRFLSWKVLVALVVFGLAIAPMLYAYYHQFDLHPEKIIRGKGSRSGIFFIFWEQSFERMSGEGIGKNSSDYFFFFHTFLWVFLPWTVIAILAIAERFKTLSRIKFAYRPMYEFLTLGGIVLIFIVISFAQFKLPHYLNIAIPLFSILTAAYLYDLQQLFKDKILKLLLGVQYFILALVFIVSVLICFYVFKFDNWLHYVWMIPLMAVGIRFSMKREGYYYRIITVSAFSAVILNLVMNVHFYPSLLKYQSGSEMAKVVAANDIPVDKIYKLSERHTWSLDFYNKQPVTISSIEGIRGKKDIWVYVTDEERKLLNQSGFDWDRQYTQDDFRITRLQAKFLNPATRKKALGKMHLIHIY